MALAWLALVTLRHRAAAQLRRLAEPRYALALAVGAGYLIFLVMRPRALPDPPPGAAALALLIAAAGLAVWTVWAWTFGRASRLLQFSPAEVAFLFSGPVGARALLGYRLLRGQVPVVLNAVLWAVFLGWSGGGGRPLLVFVGAWVLFTTMQLHHLLASLTRTGARGEVHAPGRVRRALVIGTTLVVAALVLVDTWPVLRVGWETGIQALLHALVEAAARPVPAAVLSPFFLLVRPLAVAAGDPWIPAALPAAALLVAHAATLGALAARFRRVAVGVSLGGPPASARAATASHVRPSPPLWPLGARGHPAAAIVWKNVTAATRRRRAARIALTAVVVGAAAAVAGWTWTPVIADAAAVAALVWVGTLVLLAPQWYRHDLRSDLLHLSQVRSWPLRPTVIVAAQVAGASIVVTAIQIPLLATALLASFGSEALVPRADMLPGLALSALIILPLLNWTGVLVQNALAVLYPGWLPLGAVPPTGIEGLGQQALVLLAGLGGMALIGGPPLLAASGLWLALRDALPEAVAAAAATIVGVAALAATSLVVLRRSGARLARLEPGDIAADARDLRRG